MVTQQSAGTSRIKDDSDFFDHKPKPDATDQVRQPDNDPTAREVLPRGFEERKEPTLFKFDRPGATIEGHIAGFLRTVIENKPAVSIFLAVNGRTDQFVKIHATRQLLEKIHTTDAGRRARITYQGENETVKTAGNKMRNFSVLVDTKTEPRTDLLMDTSLQEFLQDEG